MRSAGRRRWGMVLVGVVLAGVLAGCGSSSSGPAVKNPVSKAGLSALVQAGDFPTGWKRSVSAAAPGSVLDPAVAKSISACAGVATQAGIDDKVARARSYAYSDPNSANQYQNGVWQFKTTQAAKAAFGVYASADVITCDQEGLTKAFNASLGGSTTTTGVGPNLPGSSTTGPSATVAVAPLSVPAAGDQTNAIIMTVTITSPGITSTKPTVKQVTLVVQEVRVGRYLVRYNAALYQPIAAASIPSLVAVTIARLEKAQGK